MRLARIRGFVAAMAVLGCQATPEGDLKKLGKAIEDGDSAEAVRYIDVDRTTSAFVEDLVAHALPGADTAADRRREPNLADAMGEGMIRMMQPAVEAMFRQGVYDLVSGRSIRRPGSVTEGEQVSVPRDSILQLEPKILDSKTFGDSAVVAVEIHPKDRKEPVLVDVQMKRGEEGWRVVRVDGLAAALIDSTRKRAGGT
jgi:hypothetical protein